MIWNVFANPYYWANKKKSSINIFSGGEYQAADSRKESALKYTERLIIIYIRIKYFVNYPVRTDYFSNWFYELTAPVFILQFK